MRHAFVLDLAADERAAKDLSVGGVFIPNATVEFDDECHIVLRAGTEDVTVVARAVQINELGAGFQIEGMNRELRERIAALITLARHMHLDLERKKTLTRALATGTDPNRRMPAGSIPPAMVTTSRRAARVAEGSISPIVALAPTQQDASLTDKAHAAQLAADDSAQDD